MKIDLFTVPTDHLRMELAADLGRGGYVYDDETGGPEKAVRRYFMKYLVLSRPGLITRAARLLSGLLPPDCERIAVQGIASAVLGGALSQETGVPLLLGLDDPAEGPRFGGETFSRINVVLLEDVVFTGARALAGAQALTSQGATVLAVLCLLDRQHGASRRLSEAGYALRSLFTEAQLLGERDVEGGRAGYGRD